MKTTFTAAYWDDLGVEMSRQIYTAELIPKRQADIQKTMQQWCSTERLPAVNVP